MAQLTGDQRVTLLNNATYQARVGTVMKMKAQYWLEVGTPNRSDVNRRTQKRKRFAKQVMSTSYADQVQNQVAQHWLAYYQVDPAVVDQAGIPTYDEIFNHFDPTWDFFAGVLAGDDTHTEIDW